MLTGLLEKAYSIVPRISRFLTRTGVCCRMLTRMLTYADTYADVCCRMLTRMLTYADRFLTEQSKQLTVC